METSTLNDEETGSSRLPRSKDEYFGAFSPVKQYAFASVLVVLAALIAVNVVSSRVERAIVVSRLETEALEPAKVSTFRIVETISRSTNPNGEMNLMIPNDTSETDRIVLDALVGQQVARVDILDRFGKIVYSTDHFYIGDASGYASGPVEATSTYVGSAAVSGLDGHAALIEAVITRVPVYREGSVPSHDSHETTVVMYRDVTAAIDAATAAGARFRFWMLIGVMAVVFSSLMIVAIRGHRAQTEARLQLEELLDHEHLLVSELDRRNADLKTADEERLRLLSVVTHELGNPLASISAFIGMLSKNKEGNLSEREMSMVRAIGRGDSQMRLLLKDLLDLSRVEANELDLIVAPVKLSDIVDGVAESMAPVVAQKSQTITVKHSDDLVELDGDRIRLDQVVTNLVSNASKYSPEHTEIKIFVSGDDACYNIDVIDQGIGISIED